MRTVPDPEMGAWVSKLRAYHAFDWDEGNRTKNEKHGVTQDDIASLFDGNFVFFGRIVEPEYSEWRGVIFGQASSGRHLTLIFTRRGDKLRPISCRSMRVEERQYYEARTKET